MDRDTLTECLRWSEFPASMVSIMDMDERCEVSVETCIACMVTSRELVASFATRTEAEAFVAASYGIHRQAMDGDDAHVGWWLS